MSGGVDIRKRRQGGIVEIFNPISGAYCQTFRIDDFLVEPVITYVDVLSISSGIVAMHGRVGESVGCRTATMSCGRT